MFIQFSNVKVLLYDTYKILYPSKKIEKNSSQKFIFPLSFLLIFLENYHKYSNPEKYVENVFHASRICKRKFIERDKSSKKLQIYI